MADALGGTFEDFLEWSLGELQKYLMIRGKSTTGSKKDLAARALVAFENNAPIKDCPKEFTARLVKEYQDRLEKFGIPDSYNIPETSWVSDVHQWPEMNIGQIFQFILEAKAFKTEYIGREGWKLRTPNLGYGDLRGLYSTRNDPVPEMIPEPEMIPKMTKIVPEMIPCPKRSPSSTRNDPQIIIGMDLKWRFFEASKIAVAKIRRP
ncbi:hypothetical protein QZH41_001679 [Actinostola sp. cb2023]|nr:hypothetical protein QZH41_001679 [Actinostola sp. cb2023]